MDKIGNFKTTILIRTILVIYFLTQGLVWLIFYFMKMIPDSNLESLNNWQFYVGKILPIIAVSGVLYYTDRCFDKLPGISSLLFEVPNLKGDYEGIVKQKDGKEYTVSASILQTLSCAEFELQSPGGSVSTSESITFDKPGMKKWRVNINYKNFNPLTPNDPKEYYGSCRLEYDTKNKKLTGTYYTSRQIFGTLELKKK